MKTLLILAMLGACGSCEDTDQQRLSKCNIVIGAVVPEEVKEYLEFENKDVKAWLYRKASISNYVIVCRHDTIIAIINERNFRVQNRNGYNPFLDPTSPLSPLNPLSPMNPASPLNPMNQ